MSQNAAIPSLLPVYSRIDLAFERGEGCWLFSRDGRRFLDFTTGIAVNGLGHCHPHLVKALQDQAAKLWHVSNLYRIEQLERLADRLVAHSFAETVFVGNSGAEAMEACIKMARRFQWHRGQGERNRIVTFEGAFHGRTMATISAAGGAKMVDGFAPLLEGFDRVPFGDWAALEAAVTDQTAAVMIEPIQGEGGIRPLERQFLADLRELCDAHDILLVFDEVQCGMGRTGRLFAYEHFGVTPDIMGLAKGLGGGFPVGACVATARAASGMTASTHGSTFGGNPLACAVANAVLDVMLEDGFLDRVNARGAYLRDRAEALAARYPEAIELVRGTGLMLGLKPRGNNLEFAADLRAAGLLVVPAADNVVRLLPPLIVSEAEIDQAIELIESCCRARAA
ncbi:MAG: aspartate aminotransferase family protein [Geminicoccaceae bacterium]